MYLRGRGNTRTPGGCEKNRGFTLIEVLVAIAVFATLSLSAYQVLNNVLRSDAQTRDVGNRLQKLQRALVIMDSDFRQIVGRPFRENGEEPGNKLIKMGKFLLDSDDDAMMFVRAGWRNPENRFPRGEVVRVAYRLKDEKLERLRWIYPDAPAGAEPAEMTVLDGVSEFTLQVYADGNWRDEWDQADAMPPAVKLRMDLKGYGEIERIYLLPDYVRKGDGSES